MLTIFLTYISYPVLLLNFLIQAARVQRCLVVLGFICEHSRKCQDIIRKSTTSNPTLEDSKEEYATSTSLPASTNGNVTISPKARTSDMLVIKYPLNELQATSPRGMKINHTNPHKAEEVVARMCITEITGEENRRSTG